MNKLATGSVLDYVLTSPGHRIRRAHQIAVALFSVEAQPFDITPVQYSALAAIAARDDIDATRLASLVAFERSTVGLVLERLEIKGLIDRECRFHDKRTKRLRATPSGRALLTEADEAIHRSQERLLAVLDTEQRERFLALLETLITGHGKEA